MSEPLADQQWIFVEDSPFLPARGGGEMEHLGMLRAAAKRSLLSLIILPRPPELDLKPYEAEFPGVPLLTVARRESPVYLLHPRDPFVVASRPAPKWLVGRARELAPTATGVVITSFKSWRIGQSLAKGLGLPAVLRMHNREGSYHHNLAAGTSGPRGLALRMDAVRIDRLERRLGRQAWLGGVADISTDDARWRTSAGARNVITLPPFAVDLSQPGPPREPDPDNPTVLFIGALDVATNTVAVDWLLSRVWPRVLAEIPQASLEIVGRRPSRALAERVAATAGVRLHADVPSVAPFLSRATVALNPAVTGAGVNIKLIEYLHAGIPVVSTSLATRGLALRPGTDLEVHDDPDEFACAIAKLLREPGVAAAMGRAGQAHLQELVDPDANFAALAELMNGNRVR